MKRPSLHDIGPLLRKVHSLGGIIPLGLFVIVHLWEHAAAIGGPRAYDARVIAVERVTGLTVFTVLLVYVPLLLHAAYGLLLTFREAGRLRERPSTVVLQHAAGLFTLMFIGYHLWHLRYRTGSRPMVPQDYFVELAGALSGTTDLGIPVVACVYLLGTAAVSYHLAYGLLTFGRSTGVVTSARAERRAGWALTALGVLLFVTGARTILYFATGSHGALR